MVFQLGNDNQSFVDQNAISASNYSNVSQVGFNNLSCVTQTGIAGGGL
jgi:hypothetical protein